LLYNTLYRISFRKVSFFEKTVIFSLRLIILRFCESGKILKKPARIPHPLVGGDELQELENI